VISLNAITTAIPYGKCMLFFQSNLYPTVGLQTPGELVDANFGQLPFVYNIEEEVKVCTFREVMSIHLFIDS